MQDASLKIVAGPEGVAEARIRRDLAAAYRLAAHYGWDDLIDTHISARLPGPELSFLINPHGTLFDEITASSLIKVDATGDAAHRVNPTGIVLHGAIYEGRPDVCAVIHLHTRDGVAVSTLKEGFLPLNQRALTIAAEVAVHEYVGFLTGQTEGERVRQDLGKKNLLLMRNHGTLAVGPSIAVAFVRMYSFEWACSAQVRVQSTGRPLSFVPDEILTAVGQPAQAAAAEPSHPYEELAWLALLRKARSLDPGFEC